uniref:Uncharacterized protein n=1 Tax=viral metagenome TaxID=1070528 RepID=A0A6C0E3F5_9ZZZZ
MELSIFAIVIIIIIGILLLYLLSVFICVVLCGGGSRVYNESVNVIDNSDNTIIVSVQVVKIVPIVEVDSMLQIDDTISCGIPEANVV